MKCLHNITRKGLSKNLMLLLIVLAVIFLQVSSVFATITTLTIREKAGETTPNYPLTFAHVFKKGDVMGTVAVSMSGTILPTQCDIKRHYDDGSVRHAVISVLLPQVMAHEDLQLSLIQAPATGNNGEMTKTQILSTDVQSLLRLSNISGSGYSGNVTADLRDAISTTPSLNYWLQGSVVTEVLVKQHVNNSLNAAWEARFYPGWNGIRISNSLENVEANYRGNVNYALSIKLGNSTPTQVYSKSTVTHNHSARWRKVFWLGEEPPEVEVRYDFDYLIATGHVMNYDTALSVPESNIASSYSEWLSSAHDIMDSSVLETYFATTGDRAEIGVLPRWTTRYLYTMDNRMKEKMLSLAEMASGIPIHYRESEPTQSFYGHILSIDDHPDVWLTETAYRRAGIPDPIGDVSTVWSVDRSHQASFAYIPYLITGEHYYLEEMYYWAGYNLGASDPSNASWAREGAKGLIRDQVRGEAWAIRNIADAAALAPDTDIEKDYFEEKVANNIQEWIGEHDRFPLHNWGTADPRQPHFTQEMQAISLPFHEDFMLVALSHLNELGYTTEQIIEWYGSFVINRFSHPDFNWYNGAAYYFPIQYGNDQFIATWKEASDLFSSQPASFPATDYPFSYRFLALAALSTVTDQTATQTLQSGGVQTSTGQNVYEWLHKNIHDHEKLNEDPRWAFIPRTTVSPKPGPAPTPIPTPTAIPVNSDPIAVNDAYTLNQNETLVVDMADGVLSNDSDPDGDSMMAALLDAPVYGTVTFAIDGAFIYAHTGAGTGSDSFTYTVNDGHGGTANAIVNLTITSHSEASRVTDGQVVLYTFSEGSGNVVNDRSETGTPLNLTVQNSSAVKWLPEGGLTLHSPTILTSTGAASKVITAIKQTNELTLEVWVKPANLTQDGPARIVTISEDAYNRNLTLGQGLWGNYPSELFDVRLRTTNTSSNGIPSLSSPAGSISTKLQHVVYTRNSSGQAQLYLNGVEQAGFVVSGALTTWKDDSRLALGNELNGGRPWVGELHLIAIFDRALNPAEVTQNFSAGSPAPSTGEPTLPKITEQPTVQYVLEGENATFHVWASGLAPLTYQWHRRQVNGNWEDVPGAVGDVYTTVATSLTDDGSAFRCVVENAAGQTVSHEAVLHVSRRNSKPVAVDDAYSLMNGQTLIQEVLNGVLANDSDSDGDTLTAMLVSNPIHGTVDFKTDGSFSYSHDGTTTTYDTFTYTVDDGHDGTADATVRLMITNDHGTSRVTDGQIVLYTFSEGSGAYIRSEGSGAYIRDVSGTGTPLDLTVQKNSAIQWLPQGGIKLTSPTMIASAGAATKVINAVKQTNELTLEAWVKPANLYQDGPARIVTISADAYHRNFTLGQGLWGNAPSELFDVRLRSTTTTANGIPSLSTPVGAIDTNLMHIVYIRSSSGTARIYVNGEEQAGNMTGGSLAAWKTNYRLALGNELNGGRPWLGELYLVAMLDRALNPREIAQNFSSGPPQTLSQVFMPLFQDVLSSVDEMSLDTSVSYLAKAFIVNERQSVNGDNSSEQSTARMFDREYPMIAFETMAMDDSAHPLTNDDTASIVASGTHGEDEYLSRMTPVVDHAAVPEPSTLLLLGAGVLGILIRTRKLHQKMT